LPDDHKITFHQEVYNENEKLLTVGRVVLYFIDSQTQTKVLMPDEFKSKLAPFFLD